MSVFVTQRLFEFYVDLVQHLCPNFSLEIGAHEANFSKKVKYLCPSVESFAFEANPHVFDKYQKSALDCGVNYIHAAISNENKDFISFKIQIFNEILGEEIDPAQGNHSLLTRTEGGIKYDIIDVPNLSLSKIMKNLSGKIVMWLDVEGANQKVLQSGEESFQDVDAIFIEVEEIQYWENQWLKTQVIDFLKNKGFTLIARDFEYAYQHNLVFIKNRLIDTKVRQMIYRYYIENLDFPFRQAFPADINLFFKKFITKVLSIKSRFFF